MMSGASGNVRAGRAFVEILLDQTKLERGLKSAQKKLKNFGSSLTSVGKSMLVTATLAAAPIAYATKTFADFDDQMRMVKAVSGATEEQFRRLTEVAEELGRTTSFTARQVAEGMTALGRMGFSPKEIEAAIPAVLNLARATGTDLSEAAETAANNMRVFGLNASQMAGVADILTATANGSAQTLTDLAEGLKMAGPQAAAAGDSITNVSAALGVLANMGIKGSLAGTALRKAYSQFAKVGVQEKLKSIGIATTDANGNLRAMPEIMADIAKHMNTLPSAERLAFAEEIFGLRGALAGLQLGGNIDQLDEFIKRLRSVDGTAAKTAKDMDSGIGGAFRILMSALEGCQIALGKIVAEAIGPYVKRMTTALGKVAEWIATHKKVVVIVLKVIAGIAAAGAALVALGLAFKAMAFTLHLRFRTISRSSAAALSVQVLPWMSTNSKVTSWPVVAMYSSTAARSSGSGQRFETGISSERISWLVPLRLTASWAGIPRRANSRMPGTTPEVETVRWRRARLELRWSWSQRPAFSTSSRLFIGSPIPMKTTLVSAGASGRFSFSQRRVRTNCSRISPAERLRLKPRRPVRQKAHFMAQPTWVLTQREFRPSAGMRTHSTRAPSQVS